MLSNTLDMNLLYWRMHGQITLRITIRGRRANMTIPKTLQDLIAHHTGLHWENGENLFSGPGSGRINAQLMQIKKDVELTYVLLMGCGAEITPPVLRDTYLDMVGGKYPFTIPGLGKCMRERRVQSRRMSLVELLRWHSENKPSIEKGTRENHAIYIRNVERFLSKEGTPRLYADEFRTATLYRFVDYLRTRGKKPLSDSYIALHIHFITSATEAGHDRDYLACDPLAGFCFKFVRQEHTFFLTPEHLAWLEEQDFTKPTGTFCGDPLPDRDKTEFPKVPYYGEKMQDVVNLFLLCCYIGMHYCDREGLTEKHRVQYGGAEWIQKVRRKTKRHGATAQIKLSPRAMAILDYYGGVEGLPRMGYRTNANYLIRLGQLMGLPCNLTTGMARNTFAHRGYNKWGFQDAVLSRMMGLKSADMIRHYGDMEIEGIDNAVSWGEN